MSGAALPRPKRRPLTREQLQETLILPTRCVVEITRDMTEVIQKIVYEHEVDILKEVHNGQVTVTEDPLKVGILLADRTTLTAAAAEAKKIARAGRRVQSLYLHPLHPDRFEAVDPENPEAGGRWVPDPVFLGDEMQRLRTLYGMHHEKREFYVDVVYPHEMNFLEAAGGAYVEGEETSADAA